MTKHDPTTPRSPKPLNDVESRLLDTLRLLGATTASSSLPSEKIERRTQLKHGPMMHALRELERKGLVGRVVARKDVQFHAR